MQEALNGNEVKEQTARVIGALTGALTTHTPEGAYTAADSAQSVYRYNMTEHMLMQYALDNQKDILAADKGDVAAAKRVVARREAAAIVATVGGGGLVLTAGGMTLVGAAPELVLAARLAIAGCKTNPALCLNQAGIEVRNAKGIVYYAKFEGKIINLRNYSTSAQESKARWTIDIIGNKDINKVSNLSDNKFEIKFR